MSHEEMENLLDPALYTGRAAAQTVAYLNKIKAIAEAGEAPAPIEI